MGADVSQMVTNNYKLYVKVLPATIDPPVLASNRLNPSVPVIGYYTVQVYDGPTTITINPFSVFPSSATLGYDYEYKKTTDSAWTAMNGDLFTNGAMQVTVRALD